jgi:phosphoribosylanthranilate isomerase
MDMKLELNLNDSMLEAMQKTAKQLKTTIDQLALTVLQYHLQLPRKELERLVDETVQDMANTRITKQLLRNAEREYEEMRQKYLELKSTTVATQTAVLFLDKGPGIYQVNTEGARYLAPR